MIPNSRNWAHVAKVAAWGAAACFLFTCALALLLYLSSVLLFYILRLFIDQQHASIVLIEPFFRRYWPKSAWFEFCMVILYLLCCFNDRYILSNVGPPIYALAMTFWAALRRGVGWLNGKAAAWLCVPEAWAPNRAASVRHPDPEDPAVEARLVAVIPLVLSYMAPAEHLSLWQSCRQLACEVWRCCRAAKLSLCDDRAMGRRTMLLAPASCTTPLAQLIQSRRPRFLPEPSFFRQIQSLSLSLSSMQLDTSSLESLQALLPSLRHLALDSCQIKAAPRAGEAASSHAHHSAQEQAQLSVSGCSGWQSKAVKAAAFVDSRRLQSLSTTYLDASLSRALRAGATCGPGPIAACRRWTSAWRTMSQASHCTCACPASTPRQLLQRPGSWLRSSHAGCRGARWCTAAAGRSTALQPCCPSSPCPALCTPWCCATVSARCKMVGCLPCCHCMWSGWCASGSWRKACTQSS